MTPLMKLLQKLHPFGIPTKGGSSPINCQRRVLHGEAEEFGYQTTRCLSSYYSIFVARLAIMVMLAILIGMLTMLTWHFTRVYTTNTINSLAYGLRYELLQRPILRMWNILNSTVEITIAQVKLSEYVISHYENPVPQAEQDKMYQMMKDITWAVFASRKALNAITISYKNGFVQAFHRDHRSNNTFYIYSEQVNSSTNQNQDEGEGQLHNADVTGAKVENISAIWYREPLDPATGEKTGDRRQIPPDDLIYIAGLPEVRDGAASWHVAVSKFTDSPLLSAALPVRHPSGGSIVAAVGVTTALKSVGQLMKELVDFHSGYMYLTSREGYVLATSTDAPLLRNTTGLQLVMANDSDNQMIRSGADWLQTAYGDQFPISQEVHAANVLLGKQRYYIDSFFLNLKRLPLVGVIIIPRKYIMGKVDHIGFTTLVILISASMCILAIGCVCILILTSGVSKAMKLRAELISHLDARRRAEASSNYKSQFLANMSHELRTPMAAVIGLLDILMYDGCLTNEQFATITQIHKCSTALLRLLNNILDLSKVESGKLVLEEAEFDLGKELEGLVDMFSVQCINHNVETILDLSDDIPQVVQGDSARIVQIFTNLISNSIKFTLEGHIILRGWCENSNSSTRPDLPKNQKMSQYALRRKPRQRESTPKRDCRKNDKVILWFEVEDTGCGIDPSKWESVFESFEQADPSTTRKHGGTGLGLCIVRNLVNKMGGEIKVAKKDGPGTLMQLYLVLRMPEGGTGNHVQADFAKHSLAVLLALKGSKGRFISSQWLRTNGVFTWETPEWNGLTQILQQIFQGSTTAGDGPEACSTSESFKLNRSRGIPMETKVQNIKTSNIVIIVDTSLLDQSTNIWKQQLIFLDQYHGKAKFAWILGHDTPSNIKLELQLRGHFLMVSKPLYKTKMVQILETVIKHENMENLRGRNSENAYMPQDLHECHEIDPIHYEAASSDESNISDNENLDTHTNAVHPGATKIRESTPVLRQHHLLTSSSKKEFSHAVSQNSIHRNPWFFSAEGTILDQPEDFIRNGNYENREMDDSRCYKHENGIKEKMINIRTGRAHDLEPNIAFGSSQKFYSVFPEMNLPHGGKYLTEKEHQYHIKSVLYAKEDPKLKVEEHKKASESSMLQAGQAKNEFSTQRLPASVHRSNNQNVLSKSNTEGSVASSKMVPHQTTLEGLYILLAEDNLILQRVATTMLEKAGARVLAVGDGMQAVDALKLMLCADECTRQSSTLPDDEATAVKQTEENPPFDLILMDCQMPKLDGYEATKAIRKLEAGTGCHIPIVAVTAHAMSSDEAKCLEVGMDAYLTKPIDCKLMVSTILSLTKSTV